MDTPALLHRSLLSLTILAMGGCDQPPPTKTPSPAAKVEATTASSSPEDAKLEPLCIPLSTTAGYASECLPEFCMDPSPMILGRGTTEGFRCSGCSERRDRLLQFTYRNADESAYLHLNFTKKGLKQDYSSENFRASYSGVVATRSFVHEGQSFQNSSIAQTHVEDLEYSDGRLRGRVWIEPEYLNYSLASQHDDCVSGDILGQCWCDYDGDYPRLEIQFDLSVPGS